MKKTLGIIGGMGPMATVDLFSKIVSLTDAHKDSDHIHILIDNYPQIPDRTEAIQTGSDLPAKYLIESAQRLEKQGADFIVIPCNTSHYFFDRVQNSINIPIVNMIDETAKALKNDNIRCAGIMATDGVLHTHMYERYLKLYGIKPVIPSEEIQKIIMSIIYDEVKAGKETHPERLLPWLDELTKSGVDGFILGCTELPIAFSKVTAFNFYDCTEILAKVAIKYAGYSFKEEVKL